MIDDVERRTLSRVSCLLYFKKCAMASEDSRNCFSSDNSSDESAEGPSFIDCEGAQPYLFEPYDSDASSSTDSSNDSGERQYE